MFFRKDPMKKQQEHKDVDTKQTCIVPIEQLIEKTSHSKKSKENFIPGHQHCKKFKEKLITECMADSSRMRAVSVYDYMPDLEFTKSMLETLKKPGVFSKFPF